MMRTVQFLAVCWLFVGAAIAKPPTKAPMSLPCGDYFGFQVLLDRHGFSPGQIDGKPGPNMVRALKAVQVSDHLSVTGRADCDTWHALGGDEAGELVSKYTVSDGDVKGPFVEKIPPAMVEQANLPSLAYISPLERLAEKFHASPRLLSNLNAGTAITAGEALKVPAVDPFDADMKPNPAPQPDVTIVVSRDESSLRAIAADGSLVFFAPVTTGSAHDPLPLGNWKVTGVSWYPPFHYNPKLFWDAKPHDTKTTVKPGPNNPVGVVWIDLNLPHYGLHGTPEPGEIGRAASHGCVRLTNWDAAHVVALVKPGTPVQFR
jgi:lipoprotein-anchoring transpeptidase ErfK/SrfK